MSSGPSRPPANVDGVLHGPAMLNAASAARIGVIVSVMDPEGPRNVYVSEVAAEILGSSPHELMTMAPMSMVAPEDLPRLRERVRLRQAGTTGVFRFELTAVRADGSRVPLEISTTDVKV